MKILMNRKPHVITESILKLSAKTLEFDTGLTYLIKNDSKNLSVLTRFSHLLNFIEYIYEKKHDEFDRSAVDLAKYKEDIIRYFALDKLPDSLQIINQININTVRYLAYNNSTIQYVPIFKKEILENLDKINILQFLNYFSIYDLTEYDLEGYNLANIYNNTKYERKMNITTFINRTYKRFHIGEQFIRDHKDEINWNNINYSFTNFLDVYSRDNNYSWSRCKRSINNTVGFRFIYTFGDIIPTNELYELFFFKFISYSMKCFIREELKRRNDLSKDDYKSMDDEINKYDRKKKYEG